MFLLVVRLQLKLKSHSSGHSYKTRCKSRKLPSTQQTIQFNLDEAITVSKQEKYP